jgi:hypothetical protein
MASEQGGAKKYGEQPGYVVWREIRAQQTTQSDRLPRRAAKLQPNGAGLGAPRRPGARPTLILAANEDIEL